MVEAGISEPCGTGGEKEGEHVLPRQAQACVHGKAEGVCLLTSVHEILVSVSPLCCMFLYQDYREQSVTAGKGSLAFFLLLR